MLLVTTLWLGMGTLMSRPVHLWLIPFHLLIGIMIGLAVGVYLGIVMAARGLYYRSVERGVEREFRKFFALME
jgi:hypothetical protein